LEGELADALAAVASAKSQAASERLSLEEEIENVRAEALDSEKVSGNQMKGLRREADEALRALGEREGEIRAIKVSATATQSALMSERDTLSRRLRTLQSALEEERARSVSIEAAAIAAAESRMAAKLAALQEQRSTDRSIVAEVRKVVGLFHGLFCFLTAFLTHPPHTVKPTHARMHARTLRPPIYRFVEMLLA